MCFVAFECQQQKDALLALQSARVGDFVLKFTKPRPWSGSLAFNKAKGAETAAFRVLFPVLRVASVAKLPLRVSLHEVRSITNPEFDSKPFS
jgi:hypothetical protein